MTDFGKRLGDMLKSIYDSDDDGVVDSLPAHKTSHQDTGSDEIDTTDLVGHVLSGSYVDRGDPASSDFTRPNLDTDGSPHDMDLSSIVPAGATAVHLFLEIMGTSTGLMFYFHKKSNSNTINRFQIRTQVANITLIGEGIVTLDTDRIITYGATNDAFAAYDVVVKGWII